MKALDMTSRWSPIELIIICILFEIDSLDLERLKDRLSSEVDSYEETETGTLAKLSEDLEQEFSTINANCEVVEKYIDEDHDWTDTELVRFAPVLKITYWNLYFN